MLKCPHDRKNLRATIECLRSKNATDLVNSEWQGIAFGCAEFPFVPVIDGAFLDETPQKSLDTKNFKKTNVMMGANKDEGVFFIMYYLTDLFKNEETVFVNREDFIKSVGDLNLYVKNVGREVCELMDTMNGFCGVRTELTDFVGVSLLMVLLTGYCTISDYNKCFDP